ncbi:MAG: YncE family protein [Candidatus Azobacteroides sp.]|nr:YncE family protein [Candidatus Azobacteroides sp.]
MKLKGCYFYLILTAFFMAGCSDDNDVNVETIDLPGFYVCSEGVMGQLNSSSLSFYSFADNDLFFDCFSRINKSPVGDTPNQLARYGNKMYCVVTGSGVIHVFDARTGKSVKQIDMKTGSGASKYPRAIAFYEGKAYVCSFDNTVCRIDTVTLAVDATLNVGNNPDGICVANKKLYVSNSGPYTAYDNTVSVIDPDTFTEIKKITVTVNPGKMMADQYGDVYLISKGDYVNVLQSCFQRINSDTDQLVYTSDFSASNFTIDDNSAYIYSYDYDNSGNVVNQKILVYNVKDEKIETENFITDGTTVNIPYAISVHPQTKDIFIADVTNYTAKADILQFGSDGKLKNKITDVGINPNSIVFVEK